MLQQEQADDYVICTGKTYTIEDFLDEAFTQAGLDDFNNLKNSLSSKNEIFNILLHFVVKKTVGEGI